MISFLNKFFNKGKNYKYINKTNSVKIRNIKNGLKLEDCYLYRFLYSKIKVTKDKIVSLINHKNNKNFARQSFESKENNLDLKIYVQFFENIKNYYNSLTNNKEKIISIDGTYNNDINMYDQLNMGFFDMVNKIPIDLKSFGKKNKNSEIKCAKKYINKNFDKFEKAIIVIDRGYYSYDFINFLLNKNLKFIIRCKWKAKYLIKSAIVNKNVKNYDLIMNIRKYSRIIKYDNIIEKTINISKSKKKILSHNIKIINDCILLTNVDDEKYNDQEILNLYKARWDIEIFFKYIKYNFKFQHTREKSINSLKKTYLCELIIFYLVKLIENYYSNKHKKKVKKKNIDYKINYANLIDGIYEHLIWYIIKGTLTYYKFNKFCKCYIKINQNRKNRSFPRTSKTPFTKWYIKGYSNLTKYKKIIDAINNNNINKLNKNLKCIARRIISINNKIIKIS